VLGGSAQPVAALADDQWDVRPHPAWGAELAAGRGPLTAGFRWWRSGTTQALGLAGVPDPAVRTGSLEVVSRVQVAHWQSLGVSALASGGRLSLTWQPDHLTISTGGAPVTVTLDPIHRWVAGLGVGVGLPLARDWRGALEAERRVYSLDTAHRSGGSVEFAHERFGDWSARVALTRAWAW
jgi:hypothetical protein